MALFRRADEIVVGDPHPLPQGAEFARDFVCVLLWGFSSSFRRTLNLLSVLVGARQEKSVIAQQSMTACNRVAGDGRVRVADVRPRIDIVNRGRDVKLPGHNVVVEFKGSTYPVNPGAFCS